MNLWIIPLVVAVCLLGLFGVGCAANRPFRTDFTPCDTTQAGTNCAKAVIELAYDLTHADGTCVLVGVPSEKVTIYTLPIHFNKVLTGSHGGDAHPQIDIPRIVRLVKAGRLSFDGIITDEYPLGEINSALDKMRTGRSGRILLRISS